MIRTILKLLSVFILLFMTGLAGFYLYLSTFEGKRSEKFKVFAKEVSKPLVIAHRGGSGIAPENTVAAFRRSCELGVDMLELDLRMTADGRLVVIHDSSVDRTTNGTGEVAMMTFAEIRKLDAGFHWTKDGGKTHPFRGKGIVVPTLREVFEAFPDIKINIEAKYKTPSPVKPLCNLIREFKRGDRVVVASAIYSVLEDFRHGCKKIATSASSSESVSFLAMFKIGLTKTYAANMQALQIPRSILGLEVVNKDFIKAARERNLETHVWTINKKEEMNRLVEIGVDGIMTDHPDMLLDILKTKPPDKTK